MNNLSFCWNCWIRCVEIEVIYVALIFLIGILFCNSCNIEVFSTFCLLLSLVNTGCGSCGRCFLFELYGLFRRTDEYRTLVPLFPSQVKWACAACNRRKIQCLLCFSHGLAVLGLPLNGCAASFTCAGHFLAFKSCFWITYCLQIYVVPFSNAKVVGSFRMARLNMFRRTGA